MQEVNFIAVIIAALVSMAVGWVWYEPRVFGARWAKLANLNDKKMKQQAPKAMAAAVGLSFLLAFVLSFFIFLTDRYLENPFLANALLASFWVWLGLVANRLVLHDTFEQRKREITLINIGNDFVTIMAMGLVIGLLPPAGVL